MRNEPIYEQLSDEHNIQCGIADALDEERVVDDATVRRIAGQLHRGEASALHALASSGALPDGLEREVAESIQDLPPETDSWIDALLDYADARGEDRGPREDWGELTSDEPGQPAPSPQEPARVATAGPRDRDQERFDFIDAGVSIRRGSDSGR